MECDVVRFVTYDKGKNVKWILQFKLVLCVMPTFTVF
jgi:hypothetical protein